MDVASRPSIAQRCFPEYVVTTHGCNGNSNLIPCKGREQQPSSFCLLVLMVRVLTGVEYLCPPGGKLAFGDETLAYRIDFEEYSPKSSEMFFGNITQEVAALPITTDEVKKFLSKFKRTD